MKKIFIIMLLCCTFSQLSAQGLSADTVKVVNNEAEESQISSQEVKLTKFEMMLIQSLEDEYDEVLDVVYPHYLRAYRNGQYLLVDWLTGEEKKETAEGNDAEDEEDDFSIASHYLRRHYEDELDD